MKKKQNEYFPESVSAPGGVPASFWIERERKYREYLKKNSNE